MKLTLIGLLSISFLTSCVEPQGELQPLEGDFNGQESDLAESANCERSAPIISSNVLDFKAAAGTNETNSYSLTIKDNNKDCGRTSYSLYLINPQSRIKASVPKNIYLNSGETRVLSNILSIESNLNVGTYALYTEVRDTKSSLSHGLNQRVNISTTAPSCLRRNPTLSFNPASFEGYSGSAFSYDVSVTNNNQHCSDASYSLSYMGLPSGFVSTLPSAQKIASGASKTVTVQIKSGMTLGATAVNLKVQDIQNAMYSSTGVLNFNLLALAPKCMRANPTLSITPGSFNKYTGDSFSYSVTLKNNNKYCPAATYNLSYVNLPTGFTSNIPATKMLADGVQESFVVTGVVGSIAGDYAVSLSVADSSNQNFSAVQSLNFSLTKKNQNPATVVPALVNAVRSGDNYGTRMSQAEGTRSRARGSDTSKNCRSP